MGYGKTYQKSFIYLLLLLSYAIASEICRETSVRNNKIMTIKFVGLNVGGVTPVRARLLFLGKQTWKIDIECTSGRLTQIMGDAINNIIRFFYGRLRQITRDIWANIKLMLARIENR